MGSKQNQILIADDDPPTRILLRAAISQWGYETVEASNGEEAWEILQQPEKPLLLVIDWLMPKLDGIDLCKRIRSELPNPTMPYIILLTQMTGAENIIKGLEAGANEFLSKPFNMAELRSRLSVGHTVIQYALAFRKISDLSSSISKKISTLSADAKMKEIVTELDELINVCNKIHLDKKT